MQGIIYKTLGNSKVNPRPPVNKLKYSVCVNDLSCFGAPFHFPYNFVIFVYYIV